MDKKTIATLVASIITFVLLCINTIFGTDFSIATDTLASISALVATGILWAISNYWNQDYTPVAKGMTSAMRKIKKLVEAGDAEVLDKLMALADELDEAVGNESKEVGDEDGYGE